MPDKREKPEKRVTFNIKGNVEGGIVNIGGEQTFKNTVTVNLQSHLDRAVQNIAAMPGAGQASKDELAGLVGQVREALREIPSGQEETAEKVARRLEAFLKETSEREPDRELVKISAEGLKKAAGTLASVMPSVLAIALQIIQLVSRTIH